MKQATAIQLQGEQAIIAIVEASQLQCIPLFYATHNQLGRITSFHPTRISHQGETETILFVDGLQSEARSFRNIANLPGHIQAEIKAYRLYQQSIGYAAYAHGEQKYSTLKLPYLYHLMQTDKVIDAFFHELPAGTVMETKISALLHDTLEDTAASAAEVEQKFGSRVLRAVERVTKVDEQDGEDYEANYYHQVAESPMSAFVKIADKCANTKQTLKYYSEWHAKRIIEGHELFKSIVYDKVEAPRLKYYLDTLVAGLGHR